MLRRPHRRSSLRNDAGIRHRLYLSLLGDQMILIAIDPGQNGGIAVIKDGEVYAAAKMPETIDDLYYFLFNLQAFRGPFHAMVEEQHARPAYIKRINPETHQEELTSAQGA